MLRAARAKGRLALALGDFNMIPLSLAHQLLTTHGAALDAWRVLHPSSSIGSTLDQPEKARGLEMPTAQFNLTENGATCDSVLNTWRWTEDQKKALKKGEDRRRQRGRDERTKKDDEAGDEAFVTKERGKNEGKKTQGKRKG